METNNKLIRVDLYFGIASFIILLLYTLFNFHPIFWDEAYYIYNVSLIEKYGLSIEFLLNEWGPAGPLHPTIHWILKPITHVSAPYARFVNITFLFLIILVLRQILKIVGEDNSLNKSIAIMSIPMMYVCSGMALTEVPAMFFCTLSLFLLLLSLNKINFQVSFIYSILGGLCLSFAILGRQPYLGLLLPIGLLFFQNSSTRRTALLILFFISSLILPLFVFKTWGQIQPVQGWDTHTSEGFVVWHGFLAMGYCALVSFLIAPKWFYPIRHRKDWIMFGTIFILITIINLSFNYFQFTPLKIIASKFLPSFLTVYVSQLFASLVLFLGIYFIISSLVNLYNKKDNLIQIVFILSALILVSSSCKVTHQFSSRYVAQAAPFIILMLAPYIEFNKKKIILAIVGVGIGMSSLISFFNQ